MIKVKDLLNNIELYLEIQELRDMSLTEEDIFGYIDFFCESWDFILENTVN